MDEVLVGVNGSAPSLAALDWAAHEAARRGARLRIVHALPPLSDELELAAALERVRSIQPDVEVVAERVTEGARACLLAGAETAQLVVVGTHGHGAVAGLVLGSVATGLAGDSPVPVVLVKAEAAGVTGGPVIVAVGDHPVAAVLDAAVREAELRGSPLRIAHSWWEPPVESFGAPAPLPPLDPTPVIEALRERLDGELAPWLDGPGASLTIVQGHPRELLTGLSAEASLLVTGRHEHPGRHLRALGSVAHSVVHHAACPVMVVGS